MKIALPNQPYEYITDNSNDVDAKTAFIQTAQNRRYADQAVTKGCHSVVPLADVKSFFGLDRIKVIGITGTNGKTTTAAAIYSILLDLGYGVGLQGTRGTFINEKKIVNKSLTTPSVLEIYTNIYQAVKEGCEYFVMEVSSHAIVQERIEGIDFALKILTNIKSDHLDFHKTEEEYIRVKNSFFADESMKLVNRDEEKVEFNYKNAFSYAVEGGASFKILAYSLTKGLSGMIQHFDEVEDFHSPLYGLFNLYNITAAISAVKLLTKKPFSEINAVVNNFAGVSGRMEVVSQDPLVIVDFAHTHDGMYEVLNSLREKDILVVFGAGGDRDKQKRPLMGKVAASLAKRLYITSDNPRFEEPEAIIEDILEGIDDKSNVYVNVNRKEAIAKALEDRQGDEVVIILGKGDETTQTIYDKQVPFDDREVVRELFNIN